MSAEATATPRGEELVEADPDAPAQRRATRALLGAGYVLWMAAAAAVAYIPVLPGGISSAPDQLPGSLIKLPAIMLACGLAPGVFLWPAVRSGVPSPARWGAATLPLLGLVPCFIVTMLFAVSGAAAAGPIVLVVLLMYQAPFVACAVSALVVAVDSMRTSRRVAVWLGSTLVLTLAAITGLLVDVGTRY